MFLIDPFFRQPFIWMIALRSAAVAVSGAFVFRVLPAYSPPVGREIDVVGAMIRP
ncbi:MAG: hypothetical protein ACT4PZ_22700 [Panacagrimonas sp.]